MRVRSIRFRLTVWYAAILTAGLGLFGGLTWLALRQRLISEVDRELDAGAIRFEKYFKTETAEVPEGQLRDELEEFCQALPVSSFISLRGTSGFVFRYPQGAPAPRADFRTHHHQFTWNGEQFSLEAGTPIGDVLHTLDLLRFLLLSLIPLVIAIACLGGAWISARALKPVHDITAAAFRVSIDNLSKRLPVPGTRDEIARLTEVLNSMLERLEASVNTLSQFVADASHELRTPLAVVRTSAELALRRTRTPEAYRASLQEISLETQRMTNLVEDLLLLARRDTGAAQMPLTAIDVRDVLAEVSSELRGLAELRGIRVVVSLGDRTAVIAGNRPALHRLFLVLSDNALKYSPDGGEVILAVRRDAGIVTVTVEDFGSGISSVDLPHIFERFYQADRARSEGGHGLGLSLAKSIARAHRAEIAVHSTEGAGSTFRVLFAASEALEQNRTAAGPVSSSI
jgi:two-component system heavy metal sensor histidine kinase CusS